MIINMFILINNLMGLTCYILDKYIEDINKNKNTNNANAINDNSDNDTTTNFDFNPLIKSIIDNLQNNIVKFIDVDLTELNEAKIFIKEFDKKVSVIKNKRKTSEIELFFISRKITKDFESNIERIREKGNKEKKFINGFNTHLDDIRKYFDNLTLFISMYYSFDIFTKEDRLYKMKILSYSISYAKLINSIFETMADIYPNEMGWIMECSTELVELIQTIKKFKLKLHRKLNRVNKMKPIFTYNAKK